MSQSYPVHPRGSQARILLTSVFGPYAQDDEYGSRSMNPMELYHNQVTREQGPFSLRMFHRSFGLMMIESNIDAPCTLLDFPTLERFVAEVREHEYDVIGISSIMHNIGKVRKMCDIIRAVRPSAVIVVGGHISNVPDLEKTVDLDHIVKGDGVRWFRRYLGQDEKAPIKHPLAVSGFGTRSLGITLPQRQGDTAATLIPSVGCPMGCNFCSTSALYGGKGNFVNFFEGGDELFKVICELEEKLKVSSFFVLDENFLLHKKRALRLLELMEQHNKSWSFYVFSSARVIRSYGIDQLLRLGVAWIWMGLEGEKSQYEKLDGIDTFHLVRELQSHGICVLGSTIIGLENHTPDTIGAIIDYAVSHDTDFHQFMLYTPLPGTPLYQQHLEDGSLLSEEECPAADSHGQYRLNYRHRHIPAGTETEYLRRAFTSDFAVNGPSIARMIRTMLTGWKRYKNHPDKRVRDRIRGEFNGLRYTYGPVLWATKKWYGGNAALSAGLDRTLKDLYAEFGLKARLIAPLLGRFLHYTISKEVQRLEQGWTYEPMTVYEKNEKARLLEKHSRELNWIEPQRRRLVAAFSTACEFVANLKRTYAVYPNNGYVHYRSRVSAWLLAHADIRGKGLLKIRLKPCLDPQHPLILELSGAFDRINAKQLKKRIADYLREHEGTLVLNFNGLTAVEIKALEKFLKKLKGYRERIKLVSSDTLRAEIAEALAGARQYFEVLRAEELMQGA